MIRLDTIWRPKILLAAVWLLAALPLFVGGSPASAQSIMRSPNLNISSRVPTMPRIDPNVAGRAITGLNGNNIRIPPSCTAADRDSGNCSGQAATGSNARKITSKAAGNASLQASLGSRAIAGEIVAEIDGTLSDAQVEALARRHGLRRVGSQSFELIGATIGLFRITGGKTVETASREFAGDGSVRSVQPNFRYILQDQNAGLSGGDPAQYALSKLRLPQAHALADGANVTIAVIDSGIDLKHPEFAGVAISAFDALDSKEGPHAHGTGLAGAIVSHVRLMGSAPAAHILAIRAFGTSGKGAESTSYVILRGLDLAAANGAQIVNMSFAGPKSPPLYPAADASVMAVSATDAQDRLFTASNRGSYAYPDDGQFPSADGSRYNKLATELFWKP